MIRSILFAASAAALLSASPLAAAEHQTGVYVSSAARLILETPGRPGIVLRCRGGDFTIRHDGKGSDVAAAVFEGDSGDGELTPSGVIGCEKRKD